MARDGASIVSLSPPSHAFRLPSVSVSSNRPTGHAMRVLDARCTLEFPGNVSNTQIPGSGATETLTSPVLGESQARGAVRALQRFRMLMCNLGWKPPQQMGPQTSDYGLFTPSSWVHSSWGACNHSSDFYSSPATPRHPSCELSHGLSHCRRISLLSLLCKFDSWAPGEAIFYFLLILSLHKFSFTDVWVSVAAVFNLGDFAGTLGPGRPREMTVRIFCFQNSHLTVLFCLAPSAFTTAFFHFTNKQNSLLLPNLTIQRVPKACICSLGREKLY